MIDETHRVGTFLSYVMILFCVLFISSPSMEMFYIVCCGNRILQRNRVDCVQSRHSHYGNAHMR